MKGLVIGLALVNIGLAGWNVRDAQYTPAEDPSATAGTPPVATNTQTNSNLPSITLVSEAGTLIQPESATAAHCYSVGPLTSLTEVRQARDRLGSYAQAMQHRETEALVDRGYWVYLAAQETRAAALELTNQLGSMGVSDYYVVISGTDENAISLGYFHSKENAQRRQQAIQDLGFDVQLHARREAEPRYWVDFKLQSDVPAPDRQLVADSDTARRITIGCEAMDWGVSATPTYADSNSNIGLIDRSLAQNRQGFAQGGMQR